MANFKITFLLLSFSSMLIMAQYEIITEIHTLTGSNNPMEEGNGQIGLQIYNMDNQFCQVPSLDEDGIQFSMLLTHPGRIDGHYFHTWCLYVRTSVQ